MGLLTPAELDSYANLILLCPTHHSLVDQDTGTYPASRLLELKSDHERWVRDKLSERPVSAIRRGAAGVLPELNDAKAVLDVVADADEFGHEHDELESLDEVDLVAGFVQQAHDLGEMWSDFEPGYRVRAQFELQQSLRELQDAGWRVFGTRARGTIGRGTDAARWDTAYLRIVRRDSKEIVRLPQSPKP